MNCHLIKPEACEKTLAGFFYAEQMKHRIRNHIEQDETILTLLCEKQYCPAAESAVKQFRIRLKNHIKKYPVFETTHKPCHTPVNIDPDIRRMYETCAKVDVGPMASVAGMISEITLNAARKAGASEVIADNGGDIALFVKTTAVIGIYAGSALNCNLAFQIESTPRPLGICTSSGTVGHSFSYGCADAAIVISENIPLADAAATALCNHIQNPADLNRCFQFLDRLPEIQGAMVILGEQIALWGILPELVEARVEPDLITKGWNYYMESMHVKNIR